MMLPVAWKNSDKSFSFLNTLYLTVSAFSTTGLTVVDISTDMTFYGQLLLLILIIIGGLGLLFFKISIFYFAIYFLFGNRRYNYLYYEEQHFERGYILKRKTQNMLAIGFWYIVIFEIIGALALFFYFYFTFPTTPEYQKLQYYHNFSNSLWSAIFHSVSATNNAGFDIFYDSDSLKVFQNHYFVQFVFIFLFILGGLGFPFFLELNEKFQNWWKGSPKQVRFSFFVKFSVWGYILVTVIGLVGVFSLEAAFSDGFKSPNDPVHKSMAILFNTLSTRSAGFSTVEINSSFTSPTKLLMTGLMLIGSAPLSTGGGIKVTTFLILIYGVFGRYDQKNNLLIKRYAISRKNVSRAFLIFFISIVLVFGFSVIGSSEHKNIEKPIDLVDVVFDGVSALGNVGLSSVPIIDKEWTFYKIGTILLMLIGQLGIGNFQILLKRKYRFASERVPTKIIL